MLKDQINADLKEAMKARDEVRLRTIRSLRAALLEKEISVRQGGEGSLDDEQEMAVVQKAAKQRRDSIDQFQAAGRTDLVEKEQEELAIIERYLPVQMSDEDLLTALKKIVAETGASSAKDMGRVMGAAMGRLKGKADGKRIQDTVRGLLA